VESQQEGADGGQNLYRPVGDRPAGEWLRGSSDLLEVAEWYDAPHLAARFTSSNHHSHRVATILVVAGQLDHNLVPHETVRVPRQGVE